MASSQGTGVQQIVIQSALVFLLGFLCAAFLVLLAAPLFWRRANYLWHKQRAAQMPLSLTAIEADRDLLRAAHAVALRKAQMQTRLLRDKHTSALLQISADRSELEKLPLLQQAHQDLDRQNQQNLAQLATLQQQLEQTQQQQQAGTSQIAALQKEVNNLQQLSSSLQIEAANRELENDRLRREGHELRHDKKHLNMEKSELTSQVTALKTSLESEKTRNQALEQRLDRLIAELSDTKEQLERSATTARSATSSTGSKNSAAIRSGGLSKADYQLRETISALAADMAAQTAKAEGAASPIHTLLQHSENAAQPDDPAPATTGTHDGSEPRHSSALSLAARIKSHSA